MTDSIIKKLFSVNEENLDEDHIIELINDITKNKDKFNSQQLKQIKVRLNEIKSNLKKNQESYYNEEQAIKRTMNSVYGSFGNSHYLFFNIDIAEAITYQAKEINQYAEKVLNNYIMNVWHKDYDIHKKLGLKVNKQANTKYPSIYMDTDSVYVTFEDLIDSIEYMPDKYKNDKILFLRDLYEYRLKKYLNNAFDIFAKKRNTENIQKFELETIAYSGIHIFKKKYYQSIAYDDSGTSYNFNDKVKITGLEAIKSSTPKFIRENIYDILKYILRDDITIQKLVNYLKDIKKEFYKQDIDNISYNYSINNYDKYLVNDETDFKYGYKCPINVRASIFYNYLRNNSKYKNYYEKIESGNKVKMFYCKHAKNEVFAYKPGMIPKFVPKVDYEKMFYKSFIIPINSVLKVTNIPTVNKDLSYEKKLK